MNNKLPRPVFLYHHNNRKMSNFEYQWACDETKEEQIFVNQDFLPRFRKYLTQKRLGPLASTPAFSGTWNILADYDVQYPHDLERSNNLLSLTNNVEAICFVLRKLFSYKIPFTFKYHMYTEADKDVFRIPYSKLTGNCLTYVEFIPYNYIKIELVTTKDRYDVWYSISDDDENWVPYPHHAHDHFGKFWGNEEGFNEMLDLWMKRFGDTKYVDGKDMGIRDNLESTRLQLFAIRIFNDNLHVLQDTVLEYVYHVSKVYGHKFTEFGYVFEDIDNVAHHEFQALCTADHVGRHKK
jgi:hypothetical protein